MIFPCSVTYIQGNTVNVYPFLVDAANKDEALGIATRIGEKLMPVGCYQSVKVGVPSPVTPEEAFIGKDG